MKDIMNSFFALAVISLHQVDAFQPVRLPSQPSMQSRKLHSSGISHTSATVTVSQDALALRPQHEMLYMEQGVDKISLHAQEILGLAVASTIFGGLLGTHVDSSVFQTTVHTLQHVVQGWGSQGWKSYQSVLTSNPIATKGATSATVYSIGDIIAQKSNGSDEDGLDLARIARSGIAGGIGHGPLSHFWYNISEEFFNNVIHLTAWWSFLPKIVIDQTVWGPIWNSLYILLLGLMKQETPEKMIDDAKSSTVPLFLDGLKLWPLAHCVTYGLLPVENRLLWVDMVEILWVSILATKASSLDAVDNQEKSLEA